jgi:hypothetical protein
LWFEGEAFKVWLTEDMIWPVIYAFIVALCLTLRHLKKHTGLLAVDGR